MKTEKKFDQEESGKISVLVNLSTNNPSLPPLPQQQQPYNQQIHQQHRPQQLFHQQVPYHGQSYVQQPPPPQYNSLVQKQQQFNVFKPQLKRVLSPVRQQQQQEPLQSIPLPLQMADLNQQPRNLYIYVLNLAFLPYGR